MGMNCINISCVCVYRCFMGLCLCVLVPLVYLTATKCHLKYLSIFFVFTSTLETVFVDRSKKGRFPFCVYFSHLSAVGEEVLDMYE